MFAVGAFPGETAQQKGKRQILVGAVWLASIFTFPTIVSDFSAGFFWVAVANTVVLFVSLGALIALNYMPQHFQRIITTVFIAVYALQLYETAAFGGLLPSGLVVVFGLIVVLGALVAQGIRVAAWWLAAFVVSVVYSVLVPEWVDAVYVIPDPDFDAAWNLTATAFVIFAVLIYFVRQRDRFQRQSDDLLHNILPDSVADRLKDDGGMIADSYDSASVLFADVVDFTPMSAGMSPPELVGLLNDVFTTFDRFVEELGLEKIKTVGDEYMVASGIPGARPDHAQATADLALRIRDHVAVNDFDGHVIRLRIGINSGPVVAGIIGTHKFAYDLWGDTVNTASRMESAGVEGSIQVSQATYDIIRDDFVCTPRGTVAVKGKGDMDTYILVSRRTAP
jgi:guanylate cyclase